MDIKLIELRDRHTFVPIMAIRLSGRTVEETYLLTRSGFGLDREYVILLRLQDNKQSYDAHSWGVNRTMTIGHLHIEKNFDLLTSGDVVDVEYILGETDKPKQSERLDRFL